MDRVREKLNWPVWRDRLEKHGEWFVFGLAIAVGSLRFALAPFPKRDSLTYLAIVQYWVETGSYAAVVDKYPKFGLLPFSFLPIKWSAQLGIPLWPASIVWMILLNAVAAWAFCRIVRKWTSDLYLALWCGAVFAFHPAILRHAGFIMRDTPYLMFCLLGVWCFIESIQQRKWYWQLLTGVFCAMAILSRFEAIELLVLLSVCFPFYVFHLRFSRREAGKFAGLLLIGFVAAAALLLLLVGEPWVLPERFMAVVQVNLMRFVRR